MRCITNYSGINLLQLVIGLLLLQLSNPVVAGLTALPAGSKDLQHFIELMENNLDAWSFHKDDQRFDEAEDDYSKRPDALFWDTAPPLQGYRGWNEYRKAAEGWSKHIDQADISVIDKNQFKAWRYKDVVWHTMHCKVALILSNGDRPSPHCRGTVIWEWEGDRWRIAHEVFSVPAEAGASVFQGAIPDDPRVEPYAEFSELAGQLANAWGDGALEHLSQRLRPFYFQNEALTVYTPWKPFEVYEGWSRFERGLTKHVAQSFKRVNITLNDNLEAQRRGRLAWSYATLHVDTELHDGTKVSGNARQTLVWFLTDEGWRIVHEHFSFPQ